MLLFPSSSAAPVTRCFDLFAACSDAMDSGALMTKRSKSDKEYFFQDWVRQRLETIAGDRFSDMGRNGYPDFVMSDVAEGYELKGLALPGRKSIDSNSRYPKPQDRGREIFYVFGRYPTTTDMTLGLSDFIICHASFINAHSGNPKNKSFMGYGSYGDILVRDRKMYVFPLPFYTTEGTRGNRTLILPAEIPADPRFEIVGELIRREVDQLVVGYTFDFRTNDLKPEFTPNPNAGQEYHFRAYRLQGRGGAPVTMANLAAVMAEEQEEADADE